MGATSMHRKLSPGFYATILGVTAGLAAAGIVDEWPRLLTGTLIAVASIALTALIFHPDIKNFDDQDYDNFTY